MAEGRKRPGYTPKVAGSGKIPAEKKPAAGTKPTVTTPTDTDKKPADKKAVTAGAAVRTPTGKTPAGKTPAGKTPTGKAGARRAPVAKVDTLKPGAGGTHAETESVATAQEAERRWVAGERDSGGRLSGWLAGLFGRRTALLLALVALVALVLALLAVLRPGAAESTADDGNAAFVDRGETTELIAQTSSKICDAIAADGTDFDAWSERARAVLTGPALDEFNDYLPDQREVLAQTLMVADCRAESVGVRQLTFGADGPRARVVVALVISNTVNDMELNTGTPHAEVILEKHGQQWLIAGIEDIGTAAPAEAEPAEGDSAGGTEDGAESPTPGG